MVVLTASIQDWSPIPEAQIWLLSCSLIVRILYIPVYRHTWRRTEIQLQNYSNHIHSTHPNDWKKFARKKNIQIFKMGNENRNSLIQFGLESKPPEYKANSPVNQTILPTLKYGRYKWSRSPALGPSSSVHLGSALQAQPAVLHTLPAQFRQWVCIQGSHAGTNNVIVIDTFHITKPSPSVPACKCNEWT